MKDDLGTGVVSIPIALMYAGGVLKYDQAKLLNNTLMTAEEPENFAELCMLLKKTIERIDEGLSSADTTQT